MPRLRRAGGGLVITVCSGCGAGLERVLPEHDGRPDYGPFCTDCGGRSVPFMTRSQVVTRLAELTGRREPDPHNYECWAGRGGICRIGCSCLCHSTEVLP